MRRGQFYRFDGTKGESITKNGRDAGEKSRSSRTRLDFDLAWRASGAQLGRVLFPAAIALDQLLCPYVGIVIRSKLVRLR